MSKYEGKILTIDIGEGYTDSVFCAYEFGDGKSLICYGLGKSKPLHILVDDVVSIERETKSPLKQLQDESLFDTDKGLFKLNHREHDSVLSVKSSKGEWFAVADACNLYHLLYYVGAEPDEIVKTSSDVGEVSSSDYGLFDVEFVKFEKVDLAY